MKLCLKETDSRFRVGKNLSDMFPTKIILKTKKLIIAIACKLFLRMVQVN